MNAMKGFMGKASNMMSTGAGMMQKAEKDGVGMMEDASKQASGMAAQGAQLAQAGAKALADPTQYFNQILGGENYLNEMKNLALKTQEKLKENAESMSSEAHERMSGIAQSVLQMAQGGASKDQFQKKMSDILEMMNFMNV